MSLNRGKQFEAKFKSDIIKTFPNCSVDRLLDQQSGYLSITNISDFIMYNYPNIFYLECKSHKGNTFPLANLTQYDKLIQKMGIPGVRVGVVLWMIEKDIVVYLPIKFIKYLKERDYKSFNIKMLEDENLKQQFLVIPSQKKRVFLDSDYSILMSLEEGQ